MTYARLVDLRFRPGKREEGMNTISDIRRDVMEGFEGMLILLATGDQDRVTYVTFWESEHTMNGSWEQIAPRATEELKDLLAEPAIMRTTSVGEMEKITVPA